MPPATGPKGAAANTDSAATRPVAKVEPHTIASELMRRVVVCSRRQAESS